ncbi:MAG: ATP-binding protein [Atopobiaceae bacterium]
MQNDLQELALRLDALVIFRDLLDDPVIGALHRHLKTPGSATYAAFVAELFKQDEQSLTGYVEQRVVDDDNAYTQRISEKKQISAYLESAVALDLATLQAMVGLTREQLVTGIPEAAYLPDFDPGAQVDLSALFHEHIAHVDQYGLGMFARWHMFTLDGAGAIVPVLHPDTVRLHDLVDYEREKQVIVDNTEALLAGRPAANILLTGDAGTGKSSTVKAVVNELKERGLRILEVRKDQLHEIPAILDELTANPLKFILFIDDLSFSSNDDDYAALKAILEGSVAAKSRNVVVYATSNRRHLVKERFSDREGDEIHRNDTMQEIISLSERFGIHVSFYRPNKDTYLNIVAKLTEQRNLSFDTAALYAAAEKFALRRGGRSARGARQFVDGLEAGSIQL